MRMARRDLIANLARTAVLATGGYGHLGLLAAADRATRSDMVRFAPEIEPLVRLIGDTPHERCVKAIAGKPRNGLSYRQPLSALSLAGIRNINPQPPGFKLHSLFAQSCKASALPSTLPMSISSCTIFPTIRSPRSGLARPVEVPTPAPAAAIR